MPECLYDSVHIEHLKEFSLMDTWKEEELGFNSTERVLYRWKEGFYLYNGARVL